MLHNLVLLELERSQAQRELEEFLQNQEQLHQVRESSLRPRRRRFPSLKSLLRRKSLPYVDEKPSIA